MSRPPRPRCAVICCFAPQQPGFLDFSYRVQALAEQHEVTLVSNLALDMAEFDLPGLRKQQFDMPDGQAGWLGYMWRCVQWLRQERFDLVVLLGSTIAPIALARPWYRSPTATYWNEHPTHVAPPCGWGQPHKRLVRSLLRQIMFRGALASDVAMPIGEAHRDDLLAHGAKPARLSMVYMGVASTFRPAQARAPKAAGEPLQLIYVGSVQPDRGRDVMLEAMSLIQRNPQTRGRAHLTIVGAQPDQLAYGAARLAQLGATDHVTLLGRVPGQQIPAHLARAHVGLCLWEDQIWYRFNPPTKLFEYLVAGLPVMASRIRTHTAYVQQGHNGFVFDYSAEGLAACIEAALDAQLDWQGLNQRTWLSGAPYLWAQLQGQFLGVLRPLNRQAA
jgi:glycosyltransferase involved in cell wall biosynthesis